jgi:ATP-dependent RNA helicase DDX3X
MKLCGYTCPTPIQCYALPAALQGEDVFGIAQAGSGKTGAYMIPILSKLAGKVLKIAARRPGIGMPLESNARAEPLVLIIAPTRELVTQIFDHARRLCYRTMLRPCVAYGGGPVGLQRQELGKGCDVLIATVGRLKDFVGKPDLLSLARLRFVVSETFFFQSLINVRYIVFDEADELMDESWGDDLASIFSTARFGPQMQTMMFSATFNDSANEIARNYTKNRAVRIEVGRVGSTHENITQQIRWVDQELKKQALYDLLFTLKAARTLVFVNSKRTAEEVDDFLFNRSLPSTSIHADRTQREREDSVIAFRSGTAPILVATGVAARGIDIKAVHHVVNFDLPSVGHGGIGEYVHRIGRTGRIGNEGLATSFYNDRDSEIAPELIKLLIEAGQVVPKFMSEFIPAHYSVEWDEGEVEKVIPCCATPPPSSPEVSSTPENFQHANYS